jgi:beta-phosphoglucomutase-like phosphatase (HAD superfamily)
VAAAKRAGMKCIAVTTTNPAHKLRDADIVVERLDLLSTEEFRELMSGT